MTDDTVIAKSKELSKSNEATNQHQQQQQQPQPLQQPTQAQQARQPQPQHQQPLPPHQPQPQQAASGYMQTHQLPTYGFGQQAYAHGPPYNPQTQAHYQANMYHHQQFAQSGPYYPNHWLPVTYNPLMAPPAQGQPLIGKPTQTPVSGAKKRPASNLPSLKRPNGEIVDWCEIADDTTPKTTATATTTTTSTTTAATTAAPTTTATSAKITTPTSATTTTAAPTASPTTTTTTKTATKAATITPAATTAAPTTATATTTTITTTTTTTTATAASASKQTTAAPPEPTTTTVAATAAAATTTTTTATTTTAATTTKATTQTETKKEAQDDKIIETTETVAKQDVEDDKTNIKEGEDDKTNNKEEEDDKTSDKEGEDDAATTDQLRYEPWQYNPVSNRNGKKIYNKEFLLDVCKKVLKKSVFESPSNHYPHDINERVDMFVPAFSNHHSSSRQNELARRPNHHNYMGRSSAGQERRKIIAPSSSLTQEVELKTVSNPWRPAKEVKKDTPQDVAEVEDIKKKFRSILNKLTPNNFDKLSGEVTNLSIDTETKLGELIDIIFAKALSEPGYGVLYGQMCSHLKKISAGSADFGTTLLKRCQNQFQTDIYAGLNLEERNQKIDDEKDPDVKKQLQDELYEDMFNCRMRSLGLIKFIGELYKIQMLNDRIMFECINRLLSDTSDESLECLCDLLATIGEKLDKSSKSTQIKEQEKKQQKAPKLNAYQGGNKSAAAVVASGPAQTMEPEPPASLNPVFEKIHAYRKNKDLPISLRIRYKLLDICELREKDNWQSKKTKDGNPKTIEEIREAHEKKLESERRQNAMGPRRSQEGRRGLGHSSGSSNQISSLANESSGGRGGSNMHSSSSSHSIRDYPAGENMKSNYNEVEQQRNTHLSTLKYLSSRGVFGVQNKQSNKPTPKGEGLRPTNLLKHSTSGVPTDGGLMKPAAAVTKAAPQAATGTTTNIATKK